MSHYPQKSNHGTTAKRPTLAAGDKGYEYFDTDLGYPVWWDGAAWVEAAAPAPQTATVQFNTGGTAVDPSQPTPASLPHVVVTTSDLAVTGEDITVNVVDAGTGSAVAPGQYTAGPWSVVIPAGSATGSVHILSFAHSNTPAPAIPPPVDVDMEIDNLVSVQATAIGVQDTFIVTLDGAGA